ncbi:MAG: HU family DNA-binding protein, partial [Acidobacteria bacterium]|nr:HU family DNA-binding protein [Acidobacteriota bacterium]
MGSKKHLSTDPRTGITRADITDAVYRRHGGLTKTEAAEVVNKIFDTMKSNLLNGRPVKIQNFGVFEIASRKGRAGVNPVTGEGPLTQGDSTEGNFVFRANRYAPDYPGLAGQDLTPGGAIELAD